MLIVANTNMPMTKSTRPHEVPLPLRLERVDCRVCIGVFLFLFRGNGALVAYRDDDFIDDEASK
jgi:hypothetical protein